MPSSRDAPTIARRFLDLWEDQAAAFAADPALAEALGQAMAALGGAGVDSGAREGGQPHDAEPDPKPDQSEEPVPAGSQAARAAPGERDDDVAELARRVAECKARLDALGSAARAKGGRSRSGPGKRGS